MAQAFLSWQIINLPNGCWPGLFLRQGIYPSPYWDSGDMNCVGDARDENLERTRRVGLGITVGEVDTAAGLWDKEVKLASNFHSFY